MSNAPSVLGRFRRPEYTGENRCVPCTILNVVIALAASVLLSVVWLPVGVAAFAASLAVIYLRGYLVPGTPALTKRYLPASVLEAFHGRTVADEVEADDGWDAVEKRRRTVENAVDPEAFLLEADAVADDGDDLVLTPAFRDEIRDCVASFHETGVDGETIADLFRADPAAIEPLDRDHPAVEFDARIRQWPSEAAYFADLGTHQALAARTDRWASIPLEQRLDILRALRSFLDACPHCDGPITYDERVVESCCSTGEVLTFTCEDCEARLLEVPVDAIEGQ